MENILQLQHQHQCKMLLRAQDIFATFNKLRALRWANDIKFQQRRANYRRDGASCCVHSANIGHKYGEMRLWHQRKL